MQAIRPADPGKQADMLTQRQKIPDILAIKGNSRFPTGVMTERISPFPVIRIITVVRRAKQGASYQLKELMFQNLASRNYRVLQLC
jgi:hypothetical protein